MVTRWKIVLSRLTRRVLVNRGLQVAVAVAIAAATAVEAAAVEAVMVGVAARAVADETDNFNFYFHSGHCDQRDRKPGLRLRALVGFGAKIDNQARV
jgi:hypothetical protein